MSENNTSDVLVNQIELASELANRAMIDELMGNGKINEEDEVYITESNGDTRYTDEAQDVFNRWYDYFYDVIDKNRDT